MTGDGPSPQELLQELRTRIEQLEGEDDQARLEQLERLYATLESELDRDVEQAGPPRS